MARKKKPEEHANHERWMVSYADFITLLFAFFVVMYSISVVNQGKYKVLSESLVAAFKDPKKSLEPIQVGEVVRAPADLPDLGSNPQPIMSRPINPRNLPEVDQLSSDDLIDVSEQLDEIQRSVEEAMKDLIEEGLISIRRSQFWLEIEINTSILFSSGRSVLFPQIISVLQRLAQIMVGLPNQVHVEGYTDTVPIETEKFESNWELSGGRASTVVRLFQATGVEPQRLAAIGYGENHPIGDNSTVEGRAKNRRVVVVVLAQINTDASSTLEKFEKAKTSTTIGPTL
ncbi:MAG: flagellar motor protein MotD [Gammaproteobacteria bacterium]|jgi:chemotaxis protein MotB|nr:flagellar motor protein MotD [Gammaproteobacteria bacterium]MBT5202518.1 flagellar motor protein MotD [Gammaproteobacteria bacterium]MBT5601555.1 flagellar motor protein MotD [Gammaproteobacteria bacterium]MBT6247476.1 flagellar motor protein MotD [Gammaproteobacteria bacterium]